MPKYYVEIYEKIMYRVLFETEHPPGTSEFSKLTHEAIASRSDETIVEAYAFNATVFCGEMVDEKAEYVPSALWWDVK